MTTPTGPRGGFVVDDGETWYRIDGLDDAPPFFIALASDSEVWAFMSTAGSLAAGGRDAEEEDSVLKRPFSFSMARRTLHPTHVSRSLKVVENC